MPKIVAIVEGHGEVEAVPILIRRIASLSEPPVNVEVPSPIRVKRQGVMRAGELERVVELAARQSGPEGKILILLDSDSDCPKELAEEITQRAAIARADRTVSVVLAKPEFEAWLVAGATSLAGKRGLQATLSSPQNPEEIENPKAWLNSRMSGTRRYRETLDQPALAAELDLVEARTASSFDKFAREVESLLQEPVNEEPAS